MLGFVHVVADPGISRSSFGSLLEWLDEGADSEGRSYVDMRRRLVAFFTRKRCRVPDDLADETLSRVARRLEAEGGITGVTPAHYCYIVARFVFLESTRRPGEHAAEWTRDADASPPVFENDAERERQQDCLERCLEGLDPGDRDLIVGYYAGDSSGRIPARRDLAKKLRLTPNALTLRASRLRERLRTCVSSCMAQR
jgi:DNA-directed RNA polymerase specialized sigma24 family protein